MSLYHCLFHRSLSELILQLRDEHVTEDAFTMYVNRDKVLQDALKRMQKPTFRRDKAIEVVHNSNKILLPAIRPSWI